MLLVYCKQSEKSGSKVRKQVSEKTDSTEELCSPISSIERKNNL